MQQGFRNLTFVQTVASLLVALPASHAYAIALPPTSNVINVRDFGAKGDGSNDDTMAVREAFRHIPPFDVRHPWRTRIVYFPAGTYLVSDTLSRRDASGRYQPGLVLMGEDQRSTTIKLMDHAAGYDTSTRGKPVIFMSSGLLGGDPKAGGKNPELGEGNDAYLNSLEDITIEVGAGNPGAIGIDYLANNIGAIRNVTVRAVDHGLVGLSMTRRWIGPALIDHVNIEQYDIGVDVARTEYSVTLDHVDISGSRNYGLRNNSNSVAFSELRIHAESGVGIGNVGSQGLLTGIGLVISGTGKRAIDNLGTANLSNVEVSQFHSEERRGPSGDGVYVGDERNDSPAWRLPVRSIPESPKEEPGAWVNVQSFGAVDDASSDSTQAIIAAFQSGARTVFFPTGNYKISHSIVVPKTVEIVDGLFSSILPTKPTPGASRYPIFITESRSAPFVIRRFVVEGQGGSNAILEHRAPSIAALQDIVGFASGVVNQTAQAGPIMGSNISCTGGIRLAGSSGAWFRQLNVEAKGVMIEVDGAPLWILGAKTEQTLTLINAKNRAHVELVGGLVYRVKPDAAEMPLILLTESSAVASYAEEAFAPDAVYTTHLRSITAGQERDLIATDLPLRGKYGRMVGQMKIEN